MEKLLRPKRQSISERQRDAMYEAQGHRCAICDSELRAGEDHGDHVEVLGDQVASTGMQRFRLLCATCNYSICDASQRRESFILKKAITTWRRWPSKTHRCPFQPLGAERCIRGETSGILMSFGVAAPYSTREWSSQFCARETSSFKRRRVTRRASITSGCAGPPLAV